MKILFLNGLYASSLKVTFAQNCKNGSLQYPCDTFQWGVVEGLYENQTDFYVLSYPWLPCYPINYKVPNISSGDIVYKNQIIGKSIGYSPVLLYKSYSISHSVYHEVSRWIIENIKDGEKFVVLTYTPEPFFIKPLSKLKRQYPSMIIASIVTDLVDDVFNFASNLSFLKRIQCNSLIRETKRLYQYIDKFVLLSKHMEEKIPESIGRNIVIEGIYKNSDNVCSISRIPNSLLYTGALEEYAGIRVLLDAFCKISNKNYKLIICGGGPLHDFVKEKASTDSRIDFRGSVLREEAVILQKSVSLLINPRQPNGSITKYSFPSKTMEYLSSGTPMIGYQLEGIPNEYFKYMYIPEDLSIESLSDTIVHCLSKTDDDLNLFGKLARDFIITNKTAQLQIKRMIDFCI